MRRVPTGPAIILGLVALAAAVFLVADPGNVLVIDSYELVDPATIRVDIYASSAAWTRVTDMTETSSQVQITVKSWAWPVPQADIGSPQELIVTLDAPLGDRLVTDGSHEVPSKP